MANQKHTKTYFCISVLLLMSGILSCTKNDEQNPIPDKYEEIEVNLYLTIPAARQITYSDTKAEQENISFTLGSASTRSGNSIEEIEKPSIDNLWVLQFDDNQTLIRKSYQNIDPAEDSCTFNLYDSDNTTLFFIANLSDETDIDLELYSSTIRDLQKLYFQFAEDASLNKILLTGEYKGKVKEYTSIRIEMERIIAKLSLELSYKETLNNGDKLTITNIRLRNVPVNGFYYNSGIFQTLEENPNWFTDYTLQSVSATKEKFVWYIPENLQGSNPYIFNEQMKGKEHAPTYSTYIEITGEYTQSGQPVKPITISLYPGENIITDFNIRRNAHYPMTATINNLDPDNDKRVEIQ